MYVFYNVRDIYGWDVCPLMRRLEIFKYVCNKTKKKTGLIDLSRRFELFVLFAVLTVGVMMNNDMLSDG